MASEKCSLNQIPARALLQGASHALYLFDTFTNSLTELVVPGASTLGDLTWTPDGRLLTYEERDVQGQSVLHLLDVRTRQTLFTLPLQHSLLGMSWSPDSQTLIYSDGGTLPARNLKGIQMTFHSLSGTATSPFWLDGQQFSTSPSRITLDTGTPECTNRTHAWNRLLNGSDRAMLKCRYVC